MNLVRELRLEMLEVSGDGVEADFGVLEAGEEQVGLFVEGLLAEFGVVSPGVEAVDAVLDINFCFCEDFFE